MSFCGRGVVQGRSGTVRKGGKKAITKSTVTPTYDAFRRDELDTVAGWGWRIFLCEGVVNGTVLNTPSARQCENSKKAKKRRFTESTVTQTYGGFRRCELDTVAGWGWRIFLWGGVVQGRSKIRHLRVNVKFQRRQKKAIYRIGRNSNV